ncbi:MAG: hypothetical protein HZB44_07795 [Actinobacteria bacterium]|nr:hypothetical protein [Actinomycetota bacterium]
MKIDEKFEIIIADDPEHEKVYAEIILEGKFLAIVSQESGPENLMVELPGLGLVESLVMRNLELDSFITVLDEAAAYLTGSAKKYTLPSEEEPKFMGYVGDPDFHDGNIVDYEQHGRIVQVRVKGSSGKLFLVKFTDVHAVSFNEPQSMMLYSLTEMSAEPPMRKFIFTNWDDDNKAFLEIDAEQFEVLEDNRIA